MSCTAVGTYTDGADVVHTFAINQVNGTWGYATEVPDFTSMATQDASEMTTLSCTSATTCVGVGSFVDHATSTAQPIIFDETDGVWDTPVEAPGAASLNPSGIAFVGGLDCVSATTCVAGGDIINLPPATGPLVPFLIDENNGVWARDGGGAGNRGVEPPRRGRTHGLVVRCTRRLRRRRRLPGRVGQRAGVPRQRGRWRLG